MNPSMWSRTATPAVEQGPPLVAADKPALTAQDEQAALDAESASAEAAARAALVRMHREAVAHIAAIAEPWLQQTAERSGPAAAEAEHILPQHQRPSVPAAQAAAA